MDLQSAISVSAPTGVLDEHMLLIFGIMVLSGILGGMANYFLSDRQGERSGDWARYPVLGVVSAFTVPLFLNMISSTLLEGARTKPVDFYVFAGFCLIYVVVSRRFFENVALKLIGQVDQVKREMVHVRQKSEAAAEAAANAVAASAAAEAARREEAEVRVDPKVEPKDFLGYNDVEILRVLASESFVYGNLAALCEQTGLARELVSQRLTVMKQLGVIETRINDKNVLRWVVSTRGKQVLTDILGGQEDKKQA
jgi:hypothetical protein